MFSMTFGVLLKGAAACAENDAALADPGGTPMQYRLLLSLLIGLAALAAAAPASAQERKAPLDIGSRVEMFVDRWLIDRLSGDAVLRLNPPQKQEIVLETDKPWEGGVSAYFTVIPDGKKVGLYYRGFCPEGDLSDKQVTCYAESPDGINFTRPELGLHEFEGSRKNNIIQVGPQAHNFAPFLDTNPAARRSERYKAVGSVKDGLLAFASPDGIRWRQIRKEPIITKGAFDSLNIVFWDSVSQLYRCYSRYWTGNVRAIQSCTSKDFLNWTEPTPNTYDADAPVEHFYTNATRPCPGAEHIYLSFPMRFVETRTKKEGYKQLGVSDAVFMTSRDSVRWDRTFLEPWATPGPDERSWTQRSNMPATGIIQTSPNEFSMYISERYDWPDHRLRRLTVRRHGFASVHAGPGGGEVVSRPFTFTGSSLVLNYRTSAAGSIRVELQDDKGVPLPGFAITDCQDLFGDELDREFAWNGSPDLRALAGHPVRLRFVMKDADIFAIRFAASEGK